MKDWLLYSERVVTVGGNSQNTLGGVIRFLDSINVVAIDFVAYSRAAGGAPNHNACLSELALQSLPENRQQLNNIVVNENLGINWQFSGGQDRRFFFNSLSGATFKQCNWNFSAGDTLAISVINNFAAAVALGDVVACELILYYEVIGDSKNLPVWEG